MPRIVINEAPHPREPTGSRRELLKPTNPEANPRPPYHTPIHISTPLIANLKHYCFDKLFYEKLPLHIHLLQRIYP
jgi:hypothetical protein